MQFTNMITMILSTLLSLSTSALASVIPADVPPNTTATPSPLGRPYCTPTGPGVCNLAFTWWEERNPPLQHDYICVYDRYCREIGSTNGYDMGSFEIYSELPYVVVGTMNPTAHFLYAGGSYGDHCVYYNDGGTSVKQCAFDC